MMSVRKGHIFVGRRYIKVYSYVIYSDEEVDEGVSVMTYCTKEGGGALSVLL